MKGNNMEKIKELNRNVIIVVVILISLIIVMIGIHYKGNNADSLDGRWVRSDGTYIEFDEDSGTFESDSKDLFSHFGALNSGTIVEGSGTYNRGASEITFYYVEHYESSRSVSGNDVDREETYQYEIDNSTLKFIEGSESISFEKEN